jgi:murein DD-endopeptidase MepM/ murein hydrolase activator NlpD
VTKRLLLILICIASFLPTRAQLNTIPAIPADYFRNPLDIRLYLAGDFGEIRSNHFHSGIDIKTNQREGYPVYAVADGYISRLRVQIGGFGNAVYLNHPNGLTSVYGHLQRFNDKLLSSVKYHQYKQQSFTIDFDLLPIEIQVKKGDIIAWSGNTGGSSGPHLHFELRNTKTEETINPLTLGIQIPDHIKPNIGGFYLYQIDDAPFNEFTPKKYFQPLGSSGNYALKQVVPVHGLFGFGITAYDQQDGSANHNGLFSTTIKLDDEIIYETVISKFLFENTRAVNAYIDYPTKIKTGIIIQKGFASPNPKVRFYTTLKNNGLIRLKDDTAHDVEYILKDFEGNTATLHFKIKASDTKISSYQPKGKMMSFKTSNNFENGAVKVSIPEGDLYDDLDFQFGITAQPSYGNSQVFHIHNKLTPVHDTYQLSIKPDENLSPYLQKLVIMNTESGSQGGELKDGYIVVYPKTFGNFYLRIDSVAPTIVPVNVKEGVNFSQISKMIFRISDNLSGIKSFNGSIDGQWILMEYDYKTGRLWHTFDEKTGFGKHSFQLIVTDNKDNQKTYSINFFR